MNPPLIPTQAVDAGWILTIPDVYHSAVPASWSYLSTRTWGVRREQSVSLQASGLLPLCSPPVPLPAPLTPAVYESPQAPFKHQQEGVTWLTGRAGGLLADDQGLGKTKTAIDAVRVRRMQGDTGPVLVVTKRVMVGTWQEEIRQNDPGETVQEYKRRDQWTPTTAWTVTTYDYLRRDMVKKQVTGALAFPWHTVLLDESHQLRNPTAQRTRACLRLNAQYKILLSGTPMVNGFMDWWSPLVWLGAVQVGSQQFGARYGEPDPYGGWKLKPEKLPELNQLISQIQLRRLKTEVLDLPPKLVETQWVPLSSAQAKAYKQAKDEFLLTVRGKEESLENILTRLMRFKQLTGGLHLIGGDPTAHAKWDAFAERFTDFLDAGNKMVLFTQFRDQWQFLMDHCAPWHPVGIRGGMSAHEIEHAKTSFQTNPDTQVFVMTHAAREGVTLTAAQTMVFFDLEWSPAWFDQASDRVHRIGQMGTVNIIRLLSPGTIDEKTLLVNLHDKEVLQKIFNKAPATIL